MILVYIVSLIIIVKLYSTWKKENKTIDSESNPIQTKGDNENATKNRFLYPSDGLGKMEQDIVYECKTYKKNSKSDYNTESENFEIVQQSDSNTSIKS